VRQGGKGKFWGLGIGPHNKNGGVIFFFLLNFEKALKLINN